MDYPKGKENELLNGVFGIITVLFAIGYFAC